MRASPQQGGGDQALRQRVEQLEEQLVDLQVVIGTLELLARSGVRPAAPSVGSSGPMSGSEEARLDSMETQIRALTAQIEQLSSDVRAGAGRRSEAGGTRFLRRQWFGWRGRFDEHQQVRVDDRHVRSG